jgi:hypothetical protein
VAWATRSERGEWSRPHSHTDLGQHEDFLGEVGEGSSEHDAWLDWFRTIPLWIELDGLRIVHPCWHQLSMDVLTPHLTADNSLTDEAVRAARETPVFDAIEVLLKGPEIPLGDGRSYDDKDGVPADPGQLPLLGSRRHDPAPRRRAAGRRHARSLRRFARRRLAPSLHGHDAGHLRALLAQRDARRQDARGRVRR